MGNKDFGAIILMAGASSRMGCDKAFLPFNATETFLGRLLNVYSSCGILEIVVVCNLSNYHKCKAELTKWETSNIKIAVNENPEIGRNSSIRLGAASLSSAAGFFIQNIDNPFIDGALIKQMMHALKDAEVCIPVFQSKNGHPLLFNASCLEKMENLYDMLPLKKWIEKFRTNFLLSPNPEILFNVNTKQDYERFFPVEKS
jgi:CTP:molybdopterin cytidylyltransferase MocA